MKCAAAAADAVKQGQRRSSCYVAPRIKGDMFLHAFFFFAPCSNVRVKCVTPGARGCRQENKQAKRLTIPSKFMTSFLIKAKRARDIDKIN